MPLVAAGGAALAVAVVAEPSAWLGLPALALFALGMALYLRLGTPRGEPVDVAAPVQGRWLTLNSPTSRVPSHRVHAWAQTYAVDLVADPGDGSRPRFGWWPLARRPQAFPAFGQPVTAPISGEVVKAASGMRDHWSRTSPAGMAYLVLESVRELAGPLGILGNHLVIRGPDGVCVLMAHLQRGSLRARPGDRVVRGELVARCGSSGNSTEPHVHLQAMDRPSVWVAAGLPLRIDGRQPPANGDALATSQADRPGFDR